MVHRSTILPLSAHPPPNIDRLIRVIIDINGPPKIIETEAITTYSVTGNGYLFNTIFFKATQMNYETLL